MGEAGISAATQGKEGERARGAGCQEGWRGTQKQWGRARGTTYICGCKCRSGGCRHHCACGLATSQTLPRVSGMLRRGRPGRREVSSAQLGKEGRHLQQQVGWGGAVATCTGRRPILSGSGCIWGFVGALETMAASGRSEKVVVGVGWGCAPKGKRSNRF